MLALAGVKGVQTVAHSQGAPTAAHEGKHPAHPLHPLHRACPRAAAGTPPGRADFRPGQRARQQGSSAAACRATPRITASDQTRPDQTRPHHTTPHHTTPHHTTDASLRSHASALLTPATANVTACALRLAAARAKPDALKPYHRRARAPTGRASNRRRFVTKGICRVRCE